MTRSSARIPALVLALGVVSLLTDLSSEMIYPLLPLFMTSVLGAGAVSIGIVEGIAESMSALLKVVSGVWSDKTARRKPFLLAGYALAGIARPLIGLAPGWSFVLAMRVTDRFGKGLRTAPRDAMIAGAVPPDLRGRAFGVQRAMDHAGAVLGPLVAAALLSWLGLGLRGVFLLAAVPAALVIVVLIFAVRETRARATPTAVSTPSYALWRAFSPEFRWYLAALFLFTLGNSTDAFILLRLSGAGVPAAWIAVLWSAHHLVKMASAYAGGALSDRFGRRPLVLAGWAVYGLAYLAFARFESAGMLIAVFMIYGIYYGLCEPTERAWAADLAPAHLRGSAIGCYHGVVGLAALPASLFFGFLWQAAGPATAFVTGAALALAAAVMLAWTVSEPRAQDNN